MESKEVSLNCMENSFAEHLFNVPPSGLCFVYRA